MSDKFLRQFDNAISTYAGTSRAARDYPVKVLGLRGYDNHIGAPGNEFGPYDDLIVACIGSNTYPFKASTDPGWAMIRHPMASGGCAILSEAVHYFKMGEHDFTRGPWPAFVQAEQVKIYRLNTEGQVIGSSWLSSSLNLHCGAGVGAGGPGDDVGGLSAGCQIIFNPPGYFRGAPDAPWYRFYALVSSALAQYGQTVFPYKLMLAGEMI